MVTNAEAEACAMAVLVAVLIAVLITELKLAGSVDGFAPSMFECIKAL